MKPYQVIVGVRSTGSNDSFIPSQPVTVYATDEDEAHLCVHSEYLEWTILIVLTLRKVSQKVEVNMRIRTVITLKHTGEQIFGPFSEVTPDEHKELLDLLKRMSEMTYFSQVDENDNAIIIDPNSIAYIKIQKSIDST